MILSDVAAANTDKRSLCASKDKLVGFSYLQKFSSITEYKVEEDEGPSLKGTFLDYAKKCCGFLCVFDCCFLWIKTAEKLSFFIFDPFTELFITICNVGSVILMTLDHYSVQYDGM